MIILDFWSLYSTVVLLFVLFDKTQKIYINNALHIFLIYFFVKVNLCTYIQDNIC